MKVSGQIEEIFSHAVALDQNGGLKNTIYAKGSEVFIMNYDHSFLLRFRLRKSEKIFESDISFSANDYDSNNFTEEKGKIVFSVLQDGFERKKFCGTTSLSPTDVKKLFSKYVQKTEEKKASVTLSKKVLELLDRKLSHIEFTGKKGQSIKLVQRNVYSGSVIEISMKGAGGLFEDALKMSIEPIAMKTNDFAALFSFQDSLKFRFPKKGGNDKWIEVSSIDKNKRDMKAIIACCIYDEIIKIKEV